MLHRVGRHLFGFAVRGSRNYVAEKLLKAKILGKLT